MSKGFNQYMIDFTLPDILTEEFINQIPQQRAAINKLFLDGKLLSYALSLENAKLWAVVLAKSERDAVRLVHKLPLTSYMHTKVSSLTFFNGVMPAYLPDFSLN